MEPVNRKTKIIKAVLETKNEEILQLLEEDLNLPTHSETIDVEAELSTEELEELKQGLAENADHDTVSEKEFWNLVDSWIKK